MYHILYFRDHLQNNLGCQITLLTGFKKILLKWPGIFELLLNVSWWRRQQFCHGVGDVAAHVPHWAACRGPSGSLVPHTEHGQVEPSELCSALCPIGMCDGRWPAMSSDVIRGFILKLGALLGCHECV